MEYEEWLPAATAVGLVAGIAGVATLIDRLINPEQKWWWERFGPRSSAVPEEPQQAPQPPLTWPLHDKSPDFNDQNFDYRYRQEYLVVRNPRKRYTVTAPVP